MKDAVHASDQVSSKVGGFQHVAFVLSHAFVRHVVLQVGHVNSAKPKASLSVSLGRVCMQNSN